MSMYRCDGFGCARGGSCVDCRPAPTAEPAAVVLLREMAARIEARKRSAADEDDVCASAALALVTLWQQSDEASRSPWEGERNRGMSKHEAARILAAIEKAVGS